MTELVVIPEQQRMVMGILTSLEESGAIDAVGLDLSGIDDLTPERWRDIGAFLGGLGRRVNWYTGDWINWGEDAFGEEVVVQVGVEGSTRDRYDEAAQVTGLDHGTLLNISSVCRKVARSRRRRELGFWIHAEVAPLDPEDQTEWLARAIEEGWNRAQLRDAIREAKDAARGLVPVARDEGAGGGVSNSERVEQAARLVWHQSQPTSDGQYVVPAEAMSQLAAALGEE